MPSVWRESSGAMHDEVGFARSSYDVAVGSCHRLAARSQSLELHGKQFERKGAITLARMGRVRTRTLGVHLSTLFWVWPMWEA